MICCALIGAPAISSVERPEAVGGSSKKRSAAAPGLQSEQQGEKLQTNEKESPQEYFEITSAAPKLPKKSAGASKSNGTFAPLVTPGTAQIDEIEPNNTSAAAQALPGNYVSVKGNVFPNGDLDFYSFTGTMGDRVYAAIMTSFSANASTDSQLRLIASDGMTEIEFDDDNGSLGGLSSTIAGATLPASGTFFLRVNHFSATNQLRPYYLYLRVQSGSPTAEVESNDTPGTANVLPANGWVSGARNPAAATEQDWFSLTLNAGDTVYLGLDLDPERNGTTWNGRLGFALFGDASNQILVVDDAGTSDLIPSEAHFFTVKTAGTYFAFVDSASAAVGGPTATYNLSVSVFPQAAMSCTTYTSTDVPKTIGPGAGLVTSTITVPGNPRIGHMRVSITLNHALMADIDAHLISPAGNDNGLFTDIGAAATGGQTMMELVLDDEAAIPPLFTVLRPVWYKPELAYRLGWFKGEDAGGTWTLALYDDVTNASGGTLTSWSITICDQPALPTCSGGGAQTTVFTTDFEANDGGFTHSGTQDEWERGLPTFAPITTCNSGVNCWKTDLDNTYNASSNQDLFSPDIDLTTFVGPATLTWAQKYQMESASFDHYFVEVQEVGGAGATRKVFEWLDATMTDTVGSPAVTIQESAGWGLFNADISDFAGKTIRVRFHVDTDTTVQLAGVAIDDVSVSACSAAEPCVITCPADITASNDMGQCGAVVNYDSPMSSGDCGTVSCSPPSGSFFPVGTTTVTCSDTGGSGASCQFMVTINDTTPPSISPQANVAAVAAATCPPSTGTVAAFSTPTASDNCPGVMTVCNPPGGSTFPVGTTTVTCTATDASGNTATTSFTVSIFNGCLQDDSVSNNVVLFNLTTGEYRYCCNGIVLKAGTGTVKKIGCVFTIEHNTGDRRVLIKVDYSTKKGNASLQAPPGTNRCAITDKNIANNTMCATCGAPVVQ